MGDKREMGRKNGKGGGVTYFGRLDERKSETGTLRFFLSIYKHGYGYGYRYGYRDIDIDIEI